MTEGRLPFDDHDSLRATEVFGVGICSPECDWVEVNDALCELAGRGRDDLIGKCWLDLTHPEDAETELAEFEMLARDKTQSYVTTKRILRNNDETIRVWCSVSAFRDDQRRVTRYVVVLKEIVTDLAERHRLELAASVFEHAKQGMFVTDANSLILDVNDAFTRITGYSREQVLGKTPAILSSGKHGPEFYETLKSELEEKGSWSGEIHNRRQNGEVFIEHLSISVIFNANGEAENYIAVFTDVTPQKSYQQRLENIAYLDPLTHLPNRSLLADRLQQAMAQTGRQDRHLAVVFMDLDGFIAINERYGHDVGDRLLVIIADRLKTFLREADTVARLGGDEFVIVVMDLAGHQESTALLNRLLSAVAQPVQIGTHVLRLTASLGVTFYPQADDISADQLLRQADQAMYQAKLAGKNRFSYFDVEQDRSQSRRQEKIERIRQGLHRGEFVVHYQPQVNMRTGSVIGAEALVRWRHPERGMLAPSEFLPLIEDHPLIADLGDYVIDTVLAQLDRWRSLGHSLSASVNVSAYQLQQADFFDRLTDQLMSHPGFVAGELELEVLETSVLHDMDLIATLIAACESVGVSCTLDDFGTGYSSLIYLRHLPARRLKIDKCFVQGMLDDSDDLAILEGVLGLARAFRRQVVAEGVETVAHGEWLLKLGCEIGQGYGIAKPMSADAFEHWLTTWRPQAVWQQQKSYDRADMPVLFAGVEYRAWINAVDAFVSGRSNIAPDLEPSRSHFSVWLWGEGRQRFRGDSAFKSLLALHEEIRVLVKSLVNQRRTSSQAIDATQRERLFELRDVLVRTMLGLVEHQLVSIEGQALWREMGESAMDGRG